jgi:hypothetical protein
MQSEITVLAISRAMNSERLAVSRKEVGDHPRVALITTGEGRAPQDIEMSRGSDAHVLQPKRQVGQLGSQCRI